MTYYFQIKQKLPWKDTPSIPYEGSWEKAVRIAKRSAKVFGREVRFTTNTELLSIDCFNKMDHQKPVLN